VQNSIQFGHLLEAVDNLELQEQETFIDILQKRISERRREEISEDIRNAEKEFEAGLCKQLTPEELIKEILE